MIVSILNNTVQVYKNPFLEKVIHYFVEIGVPLYEHKNAPKIQLNGHLQLSTFNSRTPFDIAVAIGNLETQNYFKLIGRYNKQLFNVSEDINNIDDLKFFITELAQEEQDAIFRVAATRGHMKPLAILSKLDKKYSMDEATKFAEKRNLTKIVTMFAKRKTISNDVIDALEDIGIENNKSETVALCIKDMLNRAHSKKFNAMVNEFRKD